MKKIIILSFSLLILVLTSCKKNVPVPEPAREGPGTISVTIDGSTHRFNYDQDNNSTAKARLDTRYPNLYELVVYGQKLPGFFEDFLSITITSPDPIVPGIYSFSTVPAITTDIRYCPAVIPFQSCYGSSGIVTITEMTSSYVKGTFRTNSLTNGKFNTLF